MSEKTVPTIYPETQFFWDGAKAGKLMLQSCTDCDKAYYPPRPFCPACGSRAVKAFEASGKGRLYSYVINHMPAPGYTPPFTVAVVELEEGPRMMSNILECPADPDALVLDMPLEVTFEPRGDINIPQFRPVTGDQT